MTQNRYNYGISSNGIARIASVVGAAKKPYYILAALPHDGEWVVIDEGNDRNYFEESLKNNPEIKNEFKDFAVIALPEENEKLIEEAIYKLRGGSSIEEEEDEGEFSGLYNSLVKSSVDYFRKNRIKGKKLSKILEEIHELVNERLIPDVVSGEYKNMNNYIITLEAYKFYRHLADFINNNMPEDTSNIDELAEEVRGGLIEDIVGLA